MDSSHIRLQLTREQGKVSNVCVCVMKRSLWPNPWSQQFSFLARLKVNSLSMMRCKIFCSVI